MGGLGNQLFQIFTTISLSMKTTNSFVFSDIKVLDNGKRHTYWDTILFRLKPFLRPFFRKMTIFREEGFEYNIIPLHKLMGADTCLHGYFQSYKYFNDIFPNINGIPYYEYNPITWNCLINESVILTYISFWANIQASLLYYKYYENIYSKEIGDILLSKDMYKIINTK